jgi:hypothetical protein
MYVKLCLRKENHGSLFYLANIISRFMTPSRLLSDLLGHSINKLTVGVLSPFVYLLFHGMREEEVAEICHAVSNSRQTADRKC